MKIKEYRLSLMEKLSTEENQSQCIIKCSATLKANELNINEEDLNETLAESVSYIYDDLISQNKAKIDTIGLWILYDNDQEINNSIDIVVLEDIKKYGTDDVDPFKEFFKMTMIDES